MLFPFPIIVLFPCPVFLSSVCFFLLAFQHSHIYLRKIWLFHFSLIIIFVDFFFSLFSGLSFSVFFFVVGNLYPSLVSSLVYYLTFPPLLYSVNARVGEFFVQYIHTNATCGSFPSPTLYAAVLPDGPLRGHFRG
mgnify:CR=1 FL=1